MFNHMFRLRIKKLLNLISKSCIIIFKFEFHFEIILCVLIKLNVVFFKGLLFFFKSKNLKMFQKSLYLSLRYIILFNKKI